MKFNQSKIFKNKIWLSGLLSAVLASLCCIGPFIALIGGLSSFSSLFTWLDPLRPYLIISTVIIFAFAWYNKLKPQRQKDIDCGCVNTDKPSFLHSKTLLSIITITAAVLMAFPYFSNLFYTTKNVIQPVENETYSEIITVDIEGMTCVGCEAHIYLSMENLPGIIETSVDYTSRKAQIKFNKTITSFSEIRNAINKTCCKVTDIKHPNS